MFSVEPRVLLMGQKRACLGDPEVQALSFGALHTYLEISTKEGGGWKNVLIEKEYRLVV